MASFVVVVLVSNAYKFNITSLFNLRTSINYINALSLPVFSLLYFLNLDIGLLNVHIK